MDMKKYLKGQETQKIIKVGLMNVGNEFKNVL